MSTDVQLIASLVARREDGRVLFVRYDPDDERWWLPGTDLEEYEHPDEAVDRVLATLPGLEPGGRTLSHVDSFRGRRGWHVVFHYLVDVSGDAGGEAPADWFPADDLPWTVHGNWEKTSVTRALAP